jgi:phosphoribosylamine-glycine ligase
MPKVSNLAGFSETDFTAQIEFCRHNNVGLVVVGPEKPLVEGAADFYRKGVCFDIVFKAVNG